MQTVYLIIAAVFLPLFPLGMIFNAVFQRVRVTWARVLLLLVWPLPGVWILQNSAVEISGWLLYWAVFSALLYGFRAVVVRELGVWTGFLATSAWTLVWVAQSIHKTGNDTLLLVLAFSLPLALLVLLTAELEQRYESAYAGIVNGLAQAQPRLTGVLVLTMLAVIASPLFPAFFSMLNTITGVITTLPVIALGLVFVWLLWSWSSVRLLQELLVGPAPLPGQHQIQHKDIGQAVTAVYGLLLAVLLIGGLYLSGVLL